MFLLPPEQSFVNRIFLSYVGLFLDTRTHLFQPIPNLENVNRSPQMLRFRTRRCLHLNDSICLVQIDFLVQDSRW